MVQKRLMLPEGIPYIDAYPNMTTEEAIEQVVIFDEVYPRRVGTMSDITTKEYTETIENADGTITEKKWNAYRFKDTGITFSKDYVLPSEELKITFQSGKLNGMMSAVTFDPMARMNSFGRLYVTRTTVDRCLMVCLFLKMEALMYCQVGTAQR